MQRIEVNVLTGEQAIIDLTPEEIEQALAQQAAWEAEQAQIQTTPTLEQQLADLRAELAALKGAQA
jgi:hypothetical protein